jgi:hypothetical protein
MPRRVPEGNLDSWGNLQREISEFKIFVEVSRSSAKHRQTRLIGLSFHNRPSAEIFKFQIFGVETPKHWSKVETLCFLFPALFDRVFGFSQFVSLQFFYRGPWLRDKSDLTSNTMLISQCWEMSPCSCMFLRENKFVVAYISSFSNNKQPSVLPINRPMVGKYRLLTIGKRMLIIN